jgi:hypothetical protein
MPDMQTALSTALSKMTTKEMTHVNNLLNQWADAEKTTMTNPTPTQAPSVTNNVSRRTFNFFKENPGCIKKDAIQKLTLQGLKPASTTSLITQFVNAGQFRKDGDRYYTVNDEYQSLPATRKVQAKRLQAKKLKAQPTVMVQEPIPTVFSAHETINRMTVYQAREVYQELKSMFGS